MQFKAHLVLPLLISSVAALLGATCVTECISQALAKGTCTKGQLFCLCTNLDEVLDASEPCFSTTCRKDQSEIDALKEEAATLCAGPRDVPTTASVSNPTSEPDFSSSTTAVHNGTTATTAPPTKETSPPTSTAIDTQTAPSGSPTFSTPTPSETNSAGRPHFALAVLGAAVIAAVGL